LVEGRLTAGAPFTLLGLTSGTEQALLVAPAAVTNPDSSAVVQLQVLAAAPGETQLRVPAGEAPGTYLLVTLTGSGAPTGLQLVQVDAPVPAAPTAPVPPTTPVPPPPAPAPTPAAPSTPATPSPPTASVPAAPATPTPTPTPAVSMAPAAAPVAPTAPPALALPGSVRVEAEDGELEGPVEALEAEGASGGWAVGVPEGGPEEGTSGMVLDVPADGAYVLYGRVRAPDDESSSFFVSVDGGSETLWKMPSSSSWSWHGVKPEEDPEPIAYWLRAGQHRVDVRAGENGTLLDAIVLTPRRSALPS